MTTQVEAAAREQAKVRSVLFYNAMDSNCSPGYNRFTTATMSLCYTIKNIIIKIFWTLGYSEQAHFTTWKKVCNFPKQSVKSAYFILFKIWFTFDCVQDGSGKGDYIKWHLGMSRKSINNFYWGPNFSQSRKSIWGFTFNFCPYITIQNQCAFSWKQELQETAHFL